MLGQVHCLCRSGDTQHCIRPHQPVSYLVHGAVAADRNDKGDTLLRCLSGEPDRVAGVCRANDLGLDPGRARLALDHFFDARMAGRRDRVDNEPGAMDRTCVRHSGIVGE